MLTSLTTVFHGLHLDIHDTCTIVRRLIVDFCGQAQYCNRHPHFDLPHLSWSPLNQRWTDQGPLLANLRRWGLATAALCRCGQKQTVKHVVTVDMFINKI